MKVVFAHGDFGFRSIRRNLDHCISVVERAAALGPDLIVTPELATSGYGFFEPAGTAWIAHVIPRIVERFSALTREAQSALLLGTPWWDEDTDHYSNAAIWFDEDGRCRVVHRKMGVIPGGMERWAAPGTVPSTFDWRGQKIGVLICADAYGPGVARALAADGADVLISPAAWCPGVNGPNGAWEQRTLETGLPVLVCNRTGADTQIDFSGSASGAYLNGKCLLQYDDVQPALLACELDPVSWIPAKRTFDIHPLADMGRHSVA